MADYDIFPDAEYLAIRILKDAVTADAFDPFTPRIDTKLPTSPVWDQGLILVSRIGGFSVERHRLDKPNLQVDVWADTKKTTQDLMQRARVELHRGEGKSYVTPPSVLTAVDDSLGPQYTFDSLNLQHRYVFGVYFTVHAP